MIRKILIIICLIVFCGAGYYVAQYVLDNLSAENTLDQVAETRERGLDKVFAENDDLVGWVEIEGTKIDYPVMQTTAESASDDPEYYLHRDFNKEPSESGTPFADAGSSIAGATRTRDAGDAGAVRYGDEYVALYSTWNWLIYGHHMKFGTMFHDLLKFEDKDFWEEHRTFCFDRVNIGADGKITEIDEDYEIIAAGYSQIYPEDSDVFKYYEYGAHYDEESFNEYISGIKAESLYDTGVNAEFGDQLVTLSTCAYQTEDGRFYVVGKRVK